MLEQGARSFSMCLTWLWILALEIPFLSAVTYGYMWRRFLRLPQPSDLYTDAQGSHN